MNFNTQPHTGTRPNFLRRRSPGREALLEVPIESQLALPLLRRSVSLMSLLLQDGAVDLELAASVVGLDPGLAFGTLQLANRNREAGAKPIWQLPMAVVEAGREALECLVRCAPQIESCSSGQSRRKLRALISAGVTRACVAHVLGRELGGCNPQKAYLAGLLFELPAMLQLVSNPGDIPKAAVLSAMRHCLPAGIVWEAIERAGEGNDGAHDPLAAIVLLAAGIVRSQIVGPSLEELAASALWHSWTELNHDQRCSLLVRCHEIAGLAAANLHRMDPWEFMARLERRRPWE